ncbi:hypothetical protein CP97_14774 [Aurantiacibacter atlanticus]|uniref:Uncharacterized protein n=1 Tax=Aurantiacibacter atlanticus TaxID=1648404 RepID=A0A161IUA9_9SPHN|nr:hypothetical protein CP97_14774 [Aurantiacibacter atlanticus]
MQRRRVKLPSPTAICIDDVFRRYSCGELGKTRQRGAGDCATAGLRRVA